MHDKTPPVAPASKDTARSDLAPEVHNSEQEDEDAQAQTFVEEALGRRSGFDASASEQVPTPGDDSSGTPDLVDRMKQMVSSGRIDMSAYRGEPNDDDDDSLLGRQGREDDFPRGVD